MNGKGRWSERERGSRDWRLLPVTVLGWSASLLTHAVFSMMTANGTHAGPALIAIILLMAVVAGVGLASLRLRGPNAAKLMAWHSGAMVCIAAVLACSCTALTYDLVQWNDVSSSLARKGTTPVTVRLHVVSPTVASNRRANDCQADAVLQTVTEGQLVRASVSRIRVYADQPDCAMSRQDGTYQLDGILMPSDYGSMPIWLTDVDDIRMIRAPNAVFRLVDVMQRSFFIQTGRLSDQGKVLVPGLTLGILGQDYVPTEDSTDGSGIDATYAGRLEDDFRKSGILHLMAVSGGHLAVVATLVRTICAFFVIPRRITAILTGLSYIALSCCMFPSDSVFRALLMGLAGATCLFVGRRGQALSTLCWTAMGVLLIQPYMSYSFGFALSCAAVLGIVLFADRMTDWLKAMLPLFVAQAAGMTIAAQLFTLPLQVLIEPELPVFFDSGESCGLTCRRFFHVGWTGVIGLVLDTARYRVRAGVAIRLRHRNHGDRIVAFGVGQSRHHPMGRRHTRRDVGSGCRVGLRLFGMVDASHRKTRGNAGTGHARSSYAEQSHGSIAPVGYAHVRRVEKHALGCRLMMARLSTDAARLNTMPKTSATNTPFHIVFGGDSYLNEQTVRDQCVAAQRKYPDAELIELDAMGADHYAFDEAVSPSLLSDRAIVKIVNLQGTDEKLGDAMVEYCRQACKDPTDCSIVICQHEGGVKGKRLVDQLTKAGADKQVVPDLKKADAKLNFVMQCFDRRNRRVDPMAAQQLVAVLGEKTGELAAMVAQLCFDFDDDPMGLNRVNQYLDSNPQVTGFVVADQAMAGRSADAIIAMRSAVEQGIDPIALIGALAMKLRTLAKASAVRAGTISQAEAKTNPWALKNATRQLPGWTSAGLGRCIQMLAWADEQSKTSGGDPVYALERSIELISQKGRINRS